MGPLGAFGDPWGGDWGGGFLGTLRVAFGEPRGVLEGTSGALWASMRDL